MKYTRNNYEAHALDYLEHNMTRSENDAFEKFLSANEDVRISLEACDFLSFTPQEDIVYPNKQSLFKREESFFSVKWVTRWAAIFLLLLSVGILVNVRNEPQKKGLVDHVAVVQTAPVSGETFEGQVKSQMPTKEAVNSSAREGRKGQTVRTTEGSLGKKTESLSSISDKIEQKVVRGEGETLPMPTSEQQVSPIAPTSTSTEDSQKMLALLPMRYTTYLSQPAEGEIRPITLPTNGRVKLKKKLPLSELFAQTDLVPDRYKSKDVENLKSKLLPNSIFTK